MKTKTTILTLLAALALAMPAPALADPVEGDSCELVTESGPTEGSYAWTESGLECVVLEERSSWGRSSWG